MKKYKLVEEVHGKEYVFVLGETKFLKDLNDDEAKVLVENGDARLQKIDSAQVQDLADLKQPKTK